MADTETDMVQDVSSDSSMAAATDFPKVAPMSAQEDPAKENFLPNPDERETTEGQEPQPL